MVKLKYFLLNKKKISDVYLLIVIYFFLFVYFVLKPAIFSPDTYSYFHIAISRFPVYIIFLRVFNFVFGEFYGTAIVAFQLIFGFISIHLIYKNCVKLLKLNWLLKAILFIILVLPYFPPLSVGNNIASEGIAYPLYLLLISFILDFLFRNQQRKIYLLSLTLLILSLTRGQFIYIPLLIAILYFFKIKNNLFNKKHIINVIILLMLPFITKTIDSTFKKIVYGFYLPTQYSYVNAITLPLFVSKISDSIDIKDPDHREIFIMSYKRIDSLNLLSSKVGGTAKNKYKVFHDNFPLICNQNIHDQGKEYYLKIDSTPHMNAVLTERACKEMFPVLLKNNYKEWSLIYFTGMIHGYKSIFILLFIIFTSIYSALKLYNRFSLENGIILLASLLILSNSMIVALASHSIIRYLFYNYFLGFFIIIILIRKFTLKL